MNVLNFKLLIIDNTRGHVMQHSAIADITYYYIVNQHHIIILNDTYFIACEHFFFSMSSYYNSANIQCLSTYTTHNNNMSKLKRISNKYKVFGYSYYVYQYALSGASVVLILLSTKR